MVGEKILIVEDNPINLKLAKLLLSLEGYEIATAINATEMFSALETFVPQLILMDLQLPGKNGLDITRELRLQQKYKNVCIIALTAYAMKGDEEKTKLVGCDGYLTKPISVASFTIEIAKYLAAQKTILKNSAAP